MQDREMCHLQVLSQKALLALTCFSKDTWIWVISMVNSPFSNTSVPPLVLKMGVCISLSFRYKTSSLLKSRSTRSSNLRESSFSASFLFLSLLPLPGEGVGYRLQYSGLENSMNCTVDVVAKSRTQLSNFHFHCHYRNLGFHYLLPQN